MRSIMLLRFCACGYCRVGTCRPCDFFDLICGSSAGGLIALLLGRLGLTAQEAYRIFEHHAKDIFPDTGPALKALRATVEGPTGSKAITGTIIEILTSHSTDLSIYPSFLPLEDSDHHFKDRCRVFVTAAYDASPAIDAFFRTYNGPGLSSIHNCSFVDACRATTAIFKPVLIDRTKYIAGVNGNVNPTGIALDELKRIWGPHADISCLLSIGTGREPRVRLDIQTRDEAVEAFAEAVRQCAGIADSVKRTLTVMNKEHRYFRFDEDGGPPSVEEWRNVSDIVGAAKAYMESYVSEARKIASLLSPGLPLN
ncbi:FabD/lysophospholipase-like protein [Atractiella rhizophila]|nr:FabD/lysophospholipase-like protein [Atractiella rhizophila]